MSAPPFEVPAAESALRAHPDVVDVAVFRTVARQPELRVVAIVASPSANAADLRDHVSATVATDDLPDVLVLVPDLPRDQTGGVDTERIERETLNQPGRLAFRAPRTPTELQIAAIWTEVLGRARVYADDNFLDLGGDSMTAVLLLDLTNERLGTELSLDDLLAAPSLSSLADTVDSPK